MKALRWLANIFINTFGITQPTPETQDRMAVLIGLLLAAVVVTVVAIGSVLRASFHA